MITRIGQGSAEATTVTIPAGHKVGDLLLIFAFRDGSATNPTIPAGWTNVTNTFDGTLTSVSVGWKIATSASETSGTWTNATSLMVIVLRSVDALAPVITNATSAGTTNTTTFAALTDANLRGARGYYILAFIAHRSVDTNLDVAALTGATIIHSLLGATSDHAIYEMTSDDTWPSTNQTITGTAAAWQSMVLAIRPARLLMNNYQSISAGTANAGQMSVTEIGGTFR
jgi:hypothetical protein